MTAGGADVNTHGSTAAVGARRPVEPAPGSGPARAGGRRARRSDATGEVVVIQLHSSSPRPFCFGEGNLGAKLWVKLTPVIKTNISHGCHVIIMLLKTSVRKPLQHMSHRGGIDQEGRLARAQGPE